MFRHTRKRTEDESIMPGRKNESSKPLQLLSNGGHYLEAFVVVAFTLGSYLQSIDALSPLIWRLVAAVGVLSIGYKLLRFQRWNDEKPEIKQFIVCFLIAMAELFMENGVVWLVSASDVHKYDTVPALQDNVEIFANIVASHSPLLNTFFSLKWAQTLDFFIVLLALPFSALWDQVSYSGFGVMSRVLLTLCCSRVLRMVCFMSTVLPNPRPGCYMRRFPPLPEGLFNIVMAGYTTIRGFGGCNDLIFSGHGNFWVLTPLLFQTYAPKLRVASSLLWLAVFQTSLRDVLEHWHYSVDMILAVIVTWAVWSSLAWVYPPSQPLLKRPPGSKPDPVSIPILCLIGGCLVVGLVIIIGGHA